MSCPEAKAKMQGAAAASTFCGTLLPALHETVRLPPICTHVDQNALLQRDQIVRRLPLPYHLLSQ